MAYGFNNDKTKVEIYPKSAFKKLTGRINNVAAHSFKQDYITFPSEYKDYSILTVLQKGISGWETASYVAQQNNNYLVFPCAEMDRLEECVYIGVYNVAANTRNIDVMVILVNDSLIP